VVYSIREIAEILGLTDYAVRQAVRTGKLETLDTGAYRPQYRATAHAVSEWSGIPVEEIKAAGEKARNIWG